jgi:hypothetical protein
VGITTVLKQIVAEELKLSLDNINMVLNSRLALNLVKRCLTGGLCLQKRCQTSYWGLEERLAEKLGDL